MANHEVLREANDIVLAHVVEEMQKDVLKPDGEWRIFSWLAWMLHPNKPSKEFTQRTITHLKEKP